VIEPARLYNTVPVTDMLRVRFSSGRLNLPISASVFVGFEHITGVPSSKKGEGFSVFKLQMLDSLIDRLVKLQTKAMEQGDYASMSPEAMDVMIEKLTKELHSAISRAATTPFGVALGSGDAQNGQILNLSA